jgi:hypothetical protein
MALVSLCSGLITGVSGYWGKLEISIIDTMGCEYPEYTPNQMYWGNH